MKTLIIFSSVLLASLSAFAQLTPVGWSPKSNALASMAQGTPKSLSQSFSTGVRGNISENQTIETPTVAATVFEHGVICSYVNDSHTSLRFDLTGPVIASDSVSELFEAKVRVFKNKEGVHGTIGLLDLSLTPASPFVIVSAADLGEADSILFATQYDTADGLYPGLNVGYQGYAVPIGDSVENVCGVLDHLTVFLANPGLVAVNLDFDDLSCVVDSWQIEVWTFGANPGENDLQIFNINEDHPGINGDYVEVWHGFGAANKRLRLHFSIDGETYTIPHANAWYYNPNAPFVED